jgi:hypothetical protein
MTSKLGLLSACTIAALTTTAGFAHANINVLWYTGGVGDTTGGTAAYDATISSLASPMAGDPAAGATANWNITFWSSGAMPSGSFNVLVVASPQGDWNPNPNYGPLGAAGLTSASFGSRVMLTGQDADWHVNNSPGAASFDGPRGFLRDAVSWAGSGTGLGLVMLGDTGVGTAGSEDFGFSGFTALDTATDDVQIPASEASFPINGGLTSAGLSNWSTSAHVGFTALNTTDWLGINLNGAVPGDFVTIVTASTAGGGTGGGSAVPEPSTWVMMLAGFAGFGFLGYRKTLKAGFTTA